MALVQITPPEVEPVSVTDIKGLLRIPKGNTNFDNEIASLGAAAREQCEAFTSTRYITQTWQLLLDFFPGTVDQRLIPTNLSSPFVSGSNAVLVGLRYALVPPYSSTLQSVSSFTYQDANGITQAIAPTTGYVLSKSKPARLTPPFGQFWPVAQVVVDAVQVTYTVGYGDTQAAVPYGIQKAIKSLAAHWFVNVLPSETGIPKHIKAILGPYRDIRL